jgi:hypothetical protein
MAREPESDLELDEEPMEDDQDELDLGPEHEVPPREKSRLPFILSVIVLLAAGVYFYLFPDTFMSLLGESQPQGPAASPVANEPNPTLAPPVPAPEAPQGQPGTPTAAVTPDPGMKPYTAMPPSVPTPPSAGSASDATPAMPMTAPGSVPTPLFSEGQRVTVKQDPGSPAGIGLSLDAAGTKQGALLRTGAIVTVLDAELMRNAWVYSVRSDEGTKGWISESHLAAPK